MTTHATTCSRCATTCHIDLPRGETLDPARVVCGRCRCAADRERRRLASCGVPPRHRRLAAWAALLADAPCVEYRDAIDDVRQYAMSGDSVLVLTGPRGSGKTQAAAAAIRETIRLDRDALYTTAAEMMLAIRETYSRERGDERTREALARYQTPHLLVVDEVSELAGSAHDLATLTAIVDRRYRDLRPTIMIANVEPARVAALVGASIASRATEGGGIIHWTGWPSWRGRDGGER